jgi:Flp pilus assembly protein TadG
LTSQSSAITADSMTKILNASAAVVSPFASDKLKVTVSQVLIDDAGAATVEWSKSLHGTERATGSSVTLPAALVAPNSALIWAESEYEYAPTIGYAISGTLTLKDQMYMRPRLSQKVKYPAPP